ncbi:sperm acrosome membrane-associated protein 4-like isoform X2 [Toxotes jaculatrix]|uniref:sperm acrosome membrane-associated protein 4-like isoform X2 n=1 Tax=Toxotes jaculatrix TaxID=941984 RepID=UPI001B3AC21B|nr:sperm acrosome membrane-associated protein 4-like isoform X2 [Toxotes jaculatrix]
MKKLLLVCAVFMTMFVTGESLMCKSCRVGIAGRCLFSSTETCSDSQPNCYVGNLAFNISRLMNLQIQGCLASSSCNQTERGTLLTAGYTVTRTCCSTDRCNGATSIQLPLTAALGTALMAVWSNWIL